MSLGKILDPARVLANVEARSKKHALEILSELIVGESSGEPSQLDVFEALLERERIGNTGLGNGIAIPHGRVGGLPATVGAFVKLNEGVDFGSQDGEPVGLLFAVAVADDPDADHFEQVAEVARALSDEHLAKTLADANSSRTIFELLSGYLPDPKAA